MLNSLRSAVSGMDLLAYAFKPESPPSHADLFMFGEASKYLWLMCRSVREELSATFVFIQEFVEVVSPLLLFAIPGLDSQSAQATSRALFKLVNPAYTSNAQKIDFFGFNKALYMFVMDRLPEDSVHDRTVWFCKVCNRVYRMREHHENEAWGGQDTSQSPHFEATLESSILKGEQNNLNIYTSVKQWSQTTLEDPEETYDNAIGIMDLYAHNVHTAYHHACLYTAVDLASILQDSGFATKAAADALFGAEDPPIVILIPQTTTDETPSPPPQAVEPLDENDYHMPHARNHPPLKHRRPVKKPPSKSLTNVWVDYRGRMHLQHYMYAQSGVEKTSKHKAQNNHKSEDSAAKDLGGAHSMLAHNSHPTANGRQPERHPANIQEENGRWKKSESPSSYGGVTNDSRIQNRLSDSESVSNASQNRLPPRPHTAMAKLGGKMTYANGESSQQDGNVQTAGAVTSIVRGDEQVMNMNMNMKSNGIRRSEGSYVPMMVHGSTSSLFR
jgi:hypothetical protein